MCICNKCNKFNTISLWKFHPCLRVLCIHTAPALGNHPGRLKHSVGKGNFLGKKAFTAALLSQLHSGKLQRLPAPVPMSLPVPSLDSLSTSRTQTPCRSTMCLWDTCLIMLAVSKNAWGKDTNHNSEPFTHPEHHGTAAQKK